MKYNKEIFFKRLKLLFPTSNFEIIEYSGIKRPFVAKCLDCGKTLEYNEADKVVDRNRRGLQLLCRYCEDTAQLKQRRAGVHKINKILEEKKTIVLLEEIQRMHKKSQWQCNKCNHTFQRSPSDFLKNSKCPWCEGVFQKFTIEEIKIKTFDLYGKEYEVLDNEYNYKKSERILVKHRKCGFVFKTNVYNFLRGHCCPKCKASIGELKVRNYLLSNNLVFQEQYSFENTEISSLKFDFYLENSAEKFVIEYNGRQHYEPVEYFGGEDFLKKQQERDNRKKEYCFKNNITFIEIPYYDESLLLSNKLAQRLSGQVTEDWAP